jgi:hypothetical protein
MLTIAFAACDPMRVLIVEPRANSSDKLIIYSKGDLLPYYMRGNAEFVTIQVNGKDSLYNKKWFFHYGTGVWSDSLLKVYSGYIDSLVFIRPNEYRSMSNKQEIKQYLKTHRKGVLHQRIQLSP